VLYQVSNLADASAIKVYRLLLDDSMDLIRHVGPATGDGSPKKHDQQVPEWAGKRHIRVD